MSIMFSIVNCGRFSIERGSPIAYSNLNTFEDDDKYPNRVDTDNI